MAHAKAKGKRLGRRLSIDARLLETVAYMKGRGMSIRQISDIVKMSKSLVHKTLKIFGAKKPRRSGSGNY